MLVGDVIMSAREACPDLPGVLPAPASGEVSAAPADGGPGFPTGTYFWVATYVNQWGETDPGPEGTVSTTLLNGSITISVASDFASSLGNAQVTAVNFYLGNTAGGETRQYSVVSPFVPTTINAASPFVISTPPLGNSAFLPDSGGSVASASQLFRWLTDALNHISALNGGIPDAGGIPTVYGQAQFTIPGDWQSISDAWYDGYPLFCGSSSLVYRHNTITALTGMISQTQVADTFVCELFAQPIRNAGNGQLSVALSASALLAQTPALNGWVLPFGLLMFGFPPVYEIASYTMQGTNFASLVRGLGGTNAQAWAIGTPVYELNMEFRGMRAPQLYAPGMASNTLRIPSSWVPLIHMYLLSRYRQIEQQQSEADSLMKAYEAGCKEATKKKAPVGDRQIQPADQVAVDVYPLLSRTFGGGLIP